MPKKIAGQYLVLSEGREVFGEKRPEGQLYSLQNYRAPMTFEEADGLAEKMASKEPQATYYVVELVAQYNVAHPVKKTELR